MKQNLLETMHNSNTSLKHINGNLRKLFIGYFTVIWWNCNMCRDLIK